MNKLNKLYKELEQEYNTIWNHDNIYLPTKNEIVQVSYCKSEKLYTIMTFDNNNVFKLITDDYKDLHTVEKKSEILEILKKYV